MTLSKSDSIFCVVLKASYSSPALRSACFFGDFSLAGQHVILAKSQEGVDTLGECFHGEGGFTRNQAFDIIKISSSGALQLSDLVFSQIVSRNRYIGF